MPRSANPAVAAANRSAYQKRWREKRRQAKLGLSENNNGHTATAEERLRVMAKDAIIGHLAAAQRLLMEL